MPRPETPRRLRHLRHARGGLHRERCNCFGIRVREFAQRLDGQERLVHLGTAARLGADRRATSGVRVWATRHPDG